MSLTSPLGLMRHVHRPDLRMEIIPWLNVLLLGGMLYLFSSSYIWAPGLVVNNDSKAALPEKLSLPTLAAPSDEAAPVGRFNATLDIVIPSTAVNAAKAGMDFGQFRFILDNGLYTDKAALARALVKLRQNLPGAKPVMLIKGDDQVPYGIVVQVCELAREAGFASELWAVMSAAPAAADAGTSATPAPSAASGTSPASAGTAKKP